MSKRLKVIQLIYTVSLKEGGGITRAAVELAKKLDPARFEIVIFSLGYPGTAENCEWLDKYRDQGLQVVEPPGWDIRHPYRSFLRALIALQKELSRRQADLLHSHSEFTDIAAICLKIMGVAPVILRTVHYAYAQEWKKRPMRRLILTNFLYPLLFDAEVAVNSTSTARLNRRLISRLTRRRAICIHPAIPLERFPAPQIDRLAKRRSLGVPDGALLVGSVGRLAEQKGYRFLLDAIPKVLQRLPTALFLIVGDGPLRAELEAQSQTLGVREKVIFTGGREDVEELLPCLDLFVSSSLWEGLPAVILESMACNVPVLATAIPGTQEVIEHGYNGWLVSPADPVALAEAIIQLATQAEQRLALIRGGSVTVQNFSMEKMADRYAILYEQLCSLR